MEEEGMLVKLDMGMLIMRITKYQRPLEEI